MLPPKGFSPPMYAAPSLGIPRLEPEQQRGLMRWKARVRMRERTERAEKR